MSRIGKMPIEIPQGVDVSVSSDSVTVKGAGGALTQPVHRLVRLERDGSRLRVELTDDKAVEAGALRGTTRAVLANMVRGVSKGFERKLNLVGVGYRAQAQGNRLNLQVGYSHPVAKEMPEGIKVECPTPTEIVIKGADRLAVGQIAAEVRAVRPPEPYKGKGIRYANERVVLKETKKK